jgi:nitrite reductase/ring-hydroxylating ferredoxin subunit
VKIVVARVDEFPPGTRRVVKAGGREIGVFRVGERFFAVRNRCPHQGGPLASGRIFRMMVADAPGEVRLGDEMLISCPWHGWHWDMQSGEPYAPDDPRVKAYAVDVVPGAQIGCDMQHVEKDGEPFQAETFSVSVEQDYVVLDA